MIILIASCRFLPSLINMIMNGPHQDGGESEMHHYHHHHHQFNPSLTDGINECRWLVFTSDRDLVDVFFRIWTEERSADWFWHERPASNIKRWNQDIERNKLSSEWRFSLEWDGGLKEQICCSFHSRFLTHMILCCLYVWRLSEACLMTWWRIASWDHRMPAYNDRKSESWSSTQECLMMILFHLVWPSS